jgi:broad specificity phosphatase PhoE
MTTPALPQIWLVRHGETAWSLSGQHTGRTDIPLTARGEQVSSPSIRARRTCELAGFGGVAINDPDLFEWDYGQYEGRRTAEIIAERPDWKPFEHGSPGGETLAQVAARADRVVARLRALNADALLFAHRDILRVVVARWVGLPALEASRFYMDPASISVLGYDHNATEPIIRKLNT